MDSIGQNPWDGWPMEQVAVFIKIQVMIHTGLVAMVPLSTPRPPLADRERAGNAEALASLPHPFTASVDMYQSNEAGDGLLSWSEPIEASLSTGIIGRDSDGRTRPVPVHFMIPPGSAPLEIGSSLASRTWTHLVMDSGRVARWPYGHSRIRLLVNFDRDAAWERLLDYLGVREVIRKRIRAA